MSEPSLLTTEDLAERWKVAPSTLSNWRAQRIGPKFVKIGGSKQSDVRYRMKDIIEYEKNNLSQTEVKQ